MPGCLQVGRTGQIPSTQCQIVKTQASLNKRKSSNLGVRIDDHGSSKFGLMGHSLSPLRAFTESPVNNINDIPAVAFAIFNPYLVILARKIETDSCLHVQCISLYALYIYICNIYIYIYMYIYICVYIYMGLSQNTPKIPYFYP